MGLEELLPEGSYEGMGDIPDEFDARTKWPGLVHPIRDQQRCGSCWAFSASEVLSDRVAIADGKESPVLSPEDMVSCDHGDMGCQGGRLDQAWKYLTRTGIVTDSCMPYSAWILRVFSGLKPSPPMPLAVSITCRRTS